MPRTPGSAPLTASRSLARAIRLATTVLCLLLSAASAHGQGSPVTFSAVGDYPYGSSEIPLFQQHMDQHDLYSPSDFLVHVGDIKSGSESCAESRYVIVADMLKSLSVPAFVLPGDNEWTDCSNPAQGWQWWQENFSDFERNFCLPFTVERQAVRPENWAFVHRGVLFCGINIPNGDAGDAVQRLQDDAAWVTGQLQGKGALVRACVVLGHAGPSPQRDLFFDPFVAAAVSFGKPVLYVMGDEHSWRYDSPWPASNMRRLVVEPGGAEAPVQITVGMGTTNPWSFERDPWAGNPALTNHAPCVNAGPDIVVSSGPVALPGVATDDGPPSSPDDLTVTWSALSGPGSVSFANPNAAATTASFSSAGSYALRLTASDGEQSASDDVLVTVGTGGATYALTVTTVGAGTVALNPSGGTYPAGTTVTLDAQPAAGWEFLDWNGDLSGSLDPATITMNGNRSVTAAFGPVNLAEVVLESEDDAHIRSSRPTQNYGTHTTVRARASSTEYRPYFRFDATALAPVARATLRLYVTDASDDGGVVHATSGNYAGTSTPWDEQGIVWSNAPPPEGVLAALGPVTASQWVEVDVTAAVNGTGPVAFMIVPVSSNSAYFSTHEGANPPQLVVETDTGPLPDAPDIAVTPLALDFGNLVVGTSASFPVEIRNAGTADLAVAVPSLGGSGAGSFSVEAGGAGGVLAPGGTLEVEIAFAPTTLGGKNATLTIASDDPDEPAVLVTLSGAGIATPVPNVVVTPAGHDFGSVVLGEGATKSFEVRNGGTAPLQVGSIALDATSAPEYTIDSGGGSATLAPGEARTVVVRFAPFTVGTRAGALVVASDDPDEPNVVAGLTGAGQVAPPASGEVVFEEVVSGGGSGGTVATGSIGGGTAQLYLAAVASKPYGIATGVAGLGLSWSRVDSQCGGRSQTGLDVWMAFGNASAGPVTATFGSTSQNVHVGVARYSGADPAAPLGAAVSGNTNGEDGACSGGSDGASYSFHVDASRGGSIAWSTAALRHAAHTPGAGYAEILEGSSGSGGSVAGLTIQQRAVVAPGDVTVDGSMSTSVDWAVVALEIVPAPAGDFPDVAVAPGSIAFGDVLAGATSAPRPLVVSNAGTADLDVTSLSLGGPNAGDFTIDTPALPFTLGPGATATIDVACAPQGIGAKSATLTIGSSDPDEGSFPVPLSGNGVDAIAPNVAVTPASYDFGNVVAGASATSFFAVANTGNAPLSVASVTIVGADAAEFAVLDDPGSFTLSPGETLAIEVGFTPSALGPKSASLRVASDDPDTPALDAPLSGNGVDPPVGGGQVVYEESVTGGAESAAAVSTAGSLAAVSGDLYLAAVATKPFRTADAVDGMGLAWSLVASQCGGRAQTGVEIWMARGTPGAGAVTATFGGSVASATLAVTRYSGVDATTPLGTVVSANTNGPAGSCSGGTDGSSYSLPLDVTADGAVAFAAVAIRNRTHTPGTGFA
ncbi:choice-of-anchor D domain-containing protein, partial [bacterium]|nr:choice-of-anchor D domain-containing protein [bacterium]